MKILGFSSYTPNFKAHSYQVDPKYSGMVITTDNNPYLGEEPYLVCDGYKDRKEIKMEKTDKGFSANTYVYHPDKFNYHIEYRDTGVIDLKNGKDYSLNLRKLQQEATTATRLQHRQPLINTFKKGTAMGKVLYREEAAAEDLSKLEEPTILVTQYLDPANLKNKNIIGYIFTDFEIGTLAHFSTMLRQNTQISGTVFVPETIEKLKSLDGKNVRIKLSDDSISIKESKMSSKVKKYPKIEVPELKYSNEILTSDKYTPDIVGTKAVNLRRLEEMVEEGKIDVKIPKSMALTRGYIQELFDENPEQQRNYDKNPRGNFCKESAYAPYEPEYADDRMNKLIKTLKENGVDSERIIVRSAFNGEDLPNYSAAGIYNSFISDWEPEYLYTMIVRVAQSKWGFSARNSREKYRIPSEKIQPSVIIQNKVDADYNFTLYTNNGDDKMRIEMYSGKTVYQDATNPPHVFTYDRKTKELSYDSIQLEPHLVSFDENLKLQKLDLVEDDLSKKPEVFEQVQKLVDNALVIEKEFGAPQDIEGGLLGDDIYLWQTRNIV